MEKVRFVIVGSGWRAMYYVRIARALPERFELCAMLCRTREKAEAIREARGICTSVSAEECLEMRPDFVVVAVSKASIAEVSMEWLRRGFTVLCETPAALDTDTLCRLWELQEREGAKLMVAEQYTRYPRYHSMLKALAADCIGEPYSAVVSLAHDYHGASMIRNFLREGMTAFRIQGREYTFPVTETLSRYERFTDGRVADRKRRTAVIEFRDGKVAFYDFESEQYRSPIRKNHVDIRGCRGELKDCILFYLDDGNLPREEEIRVTEREIMTGDANPNLSRFQETVNISCGGEILYEPPFGLCGLSEDETAMALVMADAAAWNAGRKEPDYPLCEALQDAYMAILLQRAIEEDRAIESEEMPWHNCREKAGQKEG